MCGWRNWKAKLSFAGVLAELGNTFLIPIEKCFNIFSLNQGRINVLPEGSHHNQTRPSSYSEAATMYKLKGQSSNMRTGQSFENKELIRLADLSSRSVKLICLADLSS